MANNLWEVSKIFSNKKIFYFNIYVDIQALYEVLGIMMNETEFLPTRNPLSKGDNTGKK